MYERARRDLLARDFADLVVGVAQYQTASGTAIGASEALQLAVDEVRATRDERRSEP